MTPVAGNHRRLISRIPPWFFVWAGTFLVQFLVLNRIADSRHFLPDGDDMKFYNDWAFKIRGQIDWKPGEANTPGTAFYGLPGYAYALASIYKVTGCYYPPFLLAQFQAALRALTATWPYDGLHGYAFALASSYGAVISQSDAYPPFIVGQFQAALHALTATWLFLLGCRAFGGDSREEKRRGTAIGVLAAIAWVLFTPGQIFSAILMPTAWVVCAFWGVTYWLVCIHEKGTASWWRPWLWIGLLAGFVAMLVATILMLLPLVVLAIALTVARGQALKTRILPVLGAVAVLMTGVYAGCSPVWIHNYFIAKDRVLLSAHDGLNFYLGNHATSNGYTSIPKGLRASQQGLLKDSLTIPEKELGRPLKRSEASAFWKEKGKAFIREQPAAWMRLIGLKFANFWNAFQYDDLSILKLLRDERAVPPGLRFGFAAALGLPGLLLCCWRWPRSRWVAGAVLLHMAALMPVFITERYRLAAAPGLLLLAAGGLWLFWESLAARAWDKVALQFTLTMACAWFVSRPQKDIGLWSLDFYKAGIRATEGRVEAAAQKDPRLAAAYLAQARRNLETAYAYVPGNAEIAFALGNAWYYGHDNPRAKLCFERAAQIGAASGRVHDGALRNLGVIALTEKQPKDAEAFFKRAIQADPDYAEAWYLLAEACRDQGDTEHATMAIENAIKRDGQNPAFQKFRDDLRKPAPPTPAPQ